MIGIMKNTLPGGGALCAIDTLSTAAALGLKGVLFNLLQDISAGLDCAEMQGVRAEADRLGLFISSGFGFVNPALPLRSGQIVEAGGGDFEAGFRRLVTLAASVGIDQPFFMVGTIEDRFDETVSWQTQSDAVVKLILGCAPLLRDLGVRPLIKTHEEITTTEIVAMIERVGSDLLGIAYDPVNVFCRLEDPVSAAHRIAPYTAQVHVDDAVVRFEGDGIRRYLAPMGEGSVDWDAIFAIIPDARVWIDMHRGQFAMPVFDPDWLARQPTIDLYEFASILAMATRFGTGEIPCDQACATERVPQAIRRLLK